MQDFDRLAAAFASALDAADIPYMIIGGLAAVVHGRTRFTDDLDITVDHSQADAIRVIEIARDVGVRILIDDPANFALQSHILPGATDENIRVDIIFGTSGYEKQAIRRAVTHPRLGVPVKYAAAEDLIIHKLIAGRGEDLADVRAILVRQQDSLNFGYVKHWVTQFDETLGTDLNHSLSLILADIGIQH